MDLNLFMKHNFKTTLYHKLTVIFTKDFYHKDTQGMLEDIYEASEQFLITPKLAATIKDCLTVNPDAHCGTIQKLLRDEIKSNPVLLKLVTLPESPTS